MKLVFPPGLDSHSKVELDTLFPFLNKDGKQVTAIASLPPTALFVESGISAPTSPRAAVLLVTPSFLAQAITVIFIILITPL